MIAALDATVGARAPVAGRDPPHGGVADYGASPILYHLRHGVLDAQEYAFQVDSHAPVPALLRLVGGQALAAGARVVEENVQLPIGGDCLTDQALHVGSLGYVRLYEHGLPAPRPDPFNDALPSLNRPPRDHHPGPLPGEEFRGASTNPCRGPGNYGNFVCKSHALLPAFRLGIE